MNFSKNDLLKQFFLFDKRFILYIICVMVVITTAGGNDEQKARRRNNERVEWSKARCNIL